MTSLYADDSDFMYEELNQARWGDEAILHDIANGVFGTFEPFTRAVTPTHEVTSDVSFDVSSTASVDSKSSDTPMSSDGFSDSSWQPRVRRSIKKRPQTKEKKSFGTITSWNDEKGYGFITMRWSNQYSLTNKSEIKSKLDKGVFVHRSQLNNHQTNAEQTKLRGTNVEFTLVLDTTSNKPQAHNVKISK